MSTYPVPERIRSIAAPFAASLLLLVVACCLTWKAPGFSPSQLVDQCDREGESRDSAPIVVVGVLMSDTRVLGSVPKHSDRRCKLQLRKLQVKVENVLKGDVTVRPAAVYYFTFAGGFDGPQPLGFWRVRGRRILWLRRDSGVLRTACDGWDGCTWGVYSGAHPYYSADPRKPTENAVADIVLTRGEGSISRNAFAGAIERGAPGPQAYLIEKYRQLTLTEVAPIKTAACIELWICAQDRGASDSSRNRAAAAMREANCGCVTKRDGSPDCGSEGNYGDPPW